MAKQGNIKDIQAKIQKLEEEKAKLLPLRKEEIYNVLEASGGLGLDNKVIAGLAVYANSAEGKRGKLLEELARIGKDYLPRHIKGKGRAININVGVKASEAGAKTETEQANG